MRALIFWSVAACAADKGGGESSPEPNETGGETGGETGQDTGEGSGFALPCDRTVPDDHESVAEGLAASEDGSVLCVRAGTWPARLEFGGRNVMIVGEGAGETILDGEGIGRVADLSAGEGPEAGLMDLTLSGGLADGGAGLRVLEPAAPTLSGLALEANACAGLESTIRGVGLYAEGGEFRDVEVSESACALDLSGGTKIYGTGAYVTGAVDADGVTVARNSGYAYEITGAMVAKDLSGSLQRLTVRGNVSEATLSCVGGGLHLSGGTSTASRLDIRDNRCASEGEVRGAGLHVFVDGALTLENVIVAGNVAEAGGAVSGGGARLSGTVTLAQADLVGNQSAGERVEGASLALEGVIVASNIALQDDNVIAEGGAAVWAYGGSVDLAWCGWGESASFGGALSAPAAGEEHLYEDARYIDVMSASPQDWDLRLQGDSPHLDAGDPDRTDEDDGTRSDIGAYGGAGM